MAKEKRGLILRGLLAAGFLGGWLPIGVMAGNPPGPSAAATPEQMAAGRTPPAQQRERLPLVHETGEPEYVVVKASRVITVSGEEFAPGTVVIEDGKITAVGKDLEYPPAATVIRATGETVMPGFVHPRTRFGLSSYRRTGVNGDQKATAEVYLGQMDLTDLVAAGYTAACFVPDGNGIPGRSAVYRTAGEPDRKPMLDPAYLHVNLGWSASDKRTLRDALKKARDEIEKVEKARKEWEEKQKAAQKEPEKKEENQEEKKEGGRSAARGPGAAEGGDEPKPAGEGAAPAKEEFTPPPIDPKYQPLVNLLQKKKDARMMVQLTKASDLHHFDDVLKPYEDLSYSLYLATGRFTDFHHVVESLGERKARLVIRPWVHYLPNTIIRYNLMAKLAEAGCEVSVIPYFDSREELLRLRSRLSELVRSGLSREAALKSLTLHPARVVGLGERLGSVEKGKDADLVFLNGDPLDAHTEVKRVMMLGKVVWTAELGR